MLAPGAIELEVEGQAILPVPSVLVPRQEGGARDEILQRRRVGRRLGGTSPRCKVELGHSLALLARVDQGGSAVELIQDLERPLRQLGGRGARPELPAHLQVQRRSFLVRDQGIGRLLHAIVRKSIRLVDSQNQVLLQRGPQHRLGIAPQHDGHRLNVDLGAKVGGQRQRLLGLAWQGAELAQHEIDDVVGVTLRADARNVPRPATGVVVEDDQLLPIQRRQEVDSEEGVAAGFLPRQARQRRGLGQGAMNRIGDELLKVPLRKRSDHDVAYDNSGIAQAIEHDSQPVRGTDVVVTAGANEEQVARIGVGRQIVDQVQAGGIGPLKIVEEDGERVLWTREGADELAQHDSQPALRLGQRQLGYARLWTDDELDLRNQVDDQLAIGTNRRCDATPPPRDLVRGLGEDVERQLMKCSNDSQIGDVALVLLELGRQEQPAPKDDGLSELIDDRRLADT